MEKIIYKKSFVSKLILAPESIVFYQELKDICATRKNVKTRNCFSKETIRFKNKTVGFMKISRKNISLYLALDPKRYVTSKYKIQDCSNKKSLQNTPLQFTIKSKRSLNFACTLLEDMFASIGASEFCIAPNVDYAEMLYPRSFDVLVQEGLIKKYIRKSLAGKDSIVEVPAVACKVHIVARLAYEAKGAANQLYVITNYNHWNFNEAVMMKKNPDDTFEVTLFFPKGTNLEFKICRSSNWENVEKGIWKEEIVNHQYVVVDKDLEVEDVIYNFRID